MIDIQRPLIIFDCESTGPNPYEDRIVELGFICLRPDRDPQEWQSYINPGIPIPYEATYGNPDKGYSGHGITDEMVAGKPAFKDLAANLLRGFTGADFAGFNVKRYDLPLMEAEFKRAGHVWSFADARVVDSFRLWQLGERRTLTDAVRYFLGTEHEGAHGAISDVRASRDVIKAQLAKWPHLPKDLAGLHDLQFPKREKVPGALDPDGKIIWKDGAAVMNFGKNWRGKRLDLMTRRDLEWIIDPTRTGISDAVRAICTEAYHGRFPNQPTLKGIE